jgi:hypothetical protein
VATQQIEANDPADAADDNGRDAVPEEDVPADLEEAVQRLFGGEVNDVADRVEAEPALFDLLDLLD